MSMVETAAIIHSIRLYYFGKTLILIAIKAVINDKSYALFFRIEESTESNNIIHFEIINGTYILDNPDDDLGNDDIKFLLMFVVANDFIQLTAITPCAVDIVHGFMFIDGVEVSCEMIHEDKDETERTGYVLVNPPFKLEVNIAFEA